MPASVEQADDALAREHDVVGDDYAHGISAVSVVALELERAAERADAVGDVDHRRAAVGAVVAHPDDEAAVLARATLTARSSRRRRQASSTASVTSTYAAVSTDAG